jgi:hypothetical protein
MDKAELIITALQQRIGEITSNYEVQIAMLRAELTMLINEKEEKEKAIQDYSNKLENITA